MTVYNPNNLIGNPKLDAKISETENAGAITGDNYLYAASASDMTGLAPTVAHNEYEAQSYEEIYPYLPPTSLHGFTNGTDSFVEINAAEGIHAEYRTHVSEQPKELKKETEKSARRD